MKTNRAIWIATLMVATLTAECRADFYGADDFNDNANDPAIWGADFVAGGGLLTEANGRLEYTTSGFPAGNPVAVRPWILNFGSYTQNWEIQMDVSVPRSPYKGISLPLVVFPGTDLKTLFANRFSVELNQFQDHGDQLKFQSAVSANSAESVVGRVVTTSTSAALRIVFDANTKVLSAYYDEDGPVSGYSWTLLGSTNVPAGWNMTSSSVFGVAVAGSSQVGSVVSSDNVFGDNFLTTSGSNTNDHFTSRTALTGFGLTVAGDNSYATLEPGDPTQGDKSVWWSWTAPTSGVYTVTAVGLPGGFYPFLGVYGGSVISNLNLIASDAFDGSDSTYAARVVINAIGGTAYAIAVSTVGGIGGGFTLSLVPSSPPTVSIINPSNNATLYVGETILLSAVASDSDGIVTNVELYLDFDLIQTSTSNSCQMSLTFTNYPTGHRLHARATDNAGITSVSDEVLFISTYPPPLNDNFANRLILTGSWLTVTGNNGYATRELRDPTAGDKSLWWAWTAPTSGVYIVTADGLGSFCPFLGVYGGATISNLNLVASDTFNGFNFPYAARVVISATGGMTYAIAVSTVLGFGGELNLFVTTPLLPGTPARFDGITKLQAGVCQLTFRTGASSNWMLQTSTNLIDWEDGYLRYLPNGLYNIQDFTDEGWTSRFYRLMAEP